MNNLQTLKIVLLTHLSRSGSTLLARMLDEYDEICVTTEGEFPLELFGVKFYSPIIFKNQSELAGYLEKVLDHTRVASWKLSNPSIIQICQSLGFPITGPTLIRVILSVYRDTYKPEAKIVIYKACPFMPWHIPASLDHFPHAKFLHLLRDPRAVFHSQMKSIDPFTGKPYSKSALKTAMDWKKAVQLSEIDSKIMELKYESLIDSPDQLMKRLLTFLELKNKGKSGSTKPFIHRMQAVDQELHKEITQAPDPAKNTVWEQNLSKSDIFRIESFLQPLMVTKGYKIHSAGDTTSKLFQLRLRLGTLIQFAGILAKRLKRVTRYVLAHPMHVFHKLRLKIYHA